MRRKITVKEILYKYSDYIKECIGNINADFSVYTDYLTNSVDSAMWLSQNVLNQLISNGTQINSNIIITEAYNSKFVLKEKQCFIVTEKPRLLYVKILNDFFIEPKPTGIHKLTDISKNCSIGKNVQINAFCSIADNVILGDNVILQGSVKIYSNVKIGHNVTIQAGSIIGSEVMSFTRDVDGSMIRFPSFGWVEIGNNVEIGSNVMIIQSSLGKTIIGNNTKINCGSYIGSTVNIGQNNYIASCVNINGSCCIGSNNFIGASAVIRNKTSIGNNNTIGAGAVVVKNIGDNLTSTGNPAKTNNKSRGIEL